MATRREERIYEWHCRMWGRVSVEAQFRKLCEEVGELGEALMGGDKHAVWEEVADCAIVLTTIAKEFHTSLAAVTDCKTDILYERLEAKEGGEVCGG